MRVMKIIGWAALAVLALVLVAGAALWRGDIPYETLQARYAAPTSHYIDLPDGVRVHYRDEGNRSGPPIILIHGYSASAADWEAWSKRLGDTYRIILPDLPGHGLTRAPKGYISSATAQVKVVDEVASSLGLTGFVIGGNSMGGGVAWRYTLAHPEKVSALVLVDAVGWPPEKTGRNDALIFKLLGNPLARPIIKNLDNSALAKQGLQAAFLDPSLVTPALVKRYTDLARAPGHRDILITPPSSEGLASKDRLSIISAPTLILFGQDDRLIPASDGERFKAAIPGSTLIVYPGVGHVPMEQIPDKSADDVRTWLGKIAAAQGWAGTAAHQITVRELPPAHPPR